MILDKNRAVRTKSTLLHELLRTEFDGIRLIMGSNREPWLHHWGRGEGGVAFSPQANSKRRFARSMRAIGGVWVPHGSGDADCTTAEKRVAVESGHSQRISRIRVPPMHLGGNN